MAAQFYEETVTVNGREYTLQHPGVPEWQKRRQEMDGLLQAKASLAGAAAGFLQK